MQVEPQIGAVVRDRIDADPVDQQGQDDEHEGTSHQPLAIAFSHRRTPFVVGEHTPVAATIPGGRQCDRDKQRVVRKRSGTRHKRSLVRLVVPVKPTLTNGHYRLHIRGVDASTAVKVPI
ncbi:hypothetical protein D3C71_1855910 [compost metagenome]